ncbi:MAG: DUF3987 domain-containing protein, partial [Planktothrix sp.]
MTQISPIIIQNFLDSGINILPINAEKKPFNVKNGKLLEWAKYKSEFITNNGLFDGAYGICQVCGTISGNLTGIDIDTKNDLNGDLWNLFWEKLQEFLPEICEHILVEQSPSGGYHLYYRAENLAKNHVIAKNKQGQGLIEIKGEGGLLTCFPTPKYRVIQGKFSNLPRLTEAQHQIVLSISQSLSEFIEFKDIKDAPRKEFSETSNEKSHFVQYNEKGDVIELLEANGWKALYSKNDKIFLRRPNSKSRVPHATFNYYPNITYIFSSNTEFEQFKGYSKSAIFCHYECGGDWKLCSKKLLDLGFGEKYERKKSTQEVAISRQILKKNENNELGIDSETMLIEQIKTELPKFPFESFPLFLQEIIPEICKVKDFPEDFLAMSMLNAVSGCLGLTYSLVLKNGWEQYGSLFTALIGPSAIGKSPTMKWAFAPLIDQEILFQKDYTRLKSEFEYNKNLSKKEKTLLNIAEAKEPVAKELVINDSTIESLLISHKNNLKGLILYVDELTSWIRKFNAYRKGGDEKNWLSIFDNGYVKSSRVTTGINFIPKSYVTVCGGIQPRVLSDLANGSLEHDGFLYRFLFVFTEMKHSLSWDELSTRQLPYQIQENYAKFIQSFINLSMNSSHKKLSLSEAANERWGQWYDNNEKMKRELSQDGKDDLTSITSKLSIYCTRFALLFQMMNHFAGESENKQIEVDAIESAIKLTEYFRVSNQMALSNIKEMKQFESDDKKSLTKSVLDWRQVFGEETELQRKSLIKRIMGLIGCATRTAD